MVRQKLDKAIKKAILKARNMIEDAVKADLNESEIRKRIDHIFSTIMGYDTFKHITQEYAIHGAGDTVHCDFAVQVNDIESQKPNLIVEIKRVNIDLAPKHIRQAAGYAIDIGCEWILLTNGKEWKLYHITFGQPPQTKLVESWNIINDEPATLASKFALISYKEIKRGCLSRLWEKSNVLTPQNILKIILSEHSISSIRRELKKITDVSVSPEELISAVRHMLNEAAVGEMEKVKISLPVKKQKKTASPKGSINEEK